MRTNNSDELKGLLEKSDVVLLLWPNILKTDPESGNSAITQSTQGGNGGGILD